MKLTAWQRHGPLVLLAISAAINVAQANKLYTLQAAPATLQEGEKVPAIDVKTLTGDPVKITFDGPVPTMLYYFSPTCGWCERNWDNVRAIVHASPGRVRFVGLTSTPKDVQKVMEEHGVQFEVYSGLSSDAIRTYHLNGTPQTVLVSAAGTVMHTWAGAYSPKPAQEIGRQFGISLPGLAASSPH